MTVRQFNTGFEHGSSDFVSANGATVVSDFLHGAGTLGQYALKVAPASSQYWTATIPEDGSINPNYVETDIAVRFYLYFVALPTNTRDIWTHQPNSTADYARLMYNASSGKLAVAWGSGALTDGPTVTTGVEYIIDLK